MSKDVSFPETAFRFQVTRFSKKCVSVQRKLIRPKVIVFTVSRLTRTQSNKGSLHIVLYNESMVCPCSRAYMRGENGKESLINGLFVQVSNFT